jgi:hypothetical protein
VRLSITGAFLLSALFLSGCSKGEIQSVYTALSAEACKKEVDKNDPNETPYLVCPGVAGYSLIVRRVDSGRKSIDVMDAAQRVFPLKYQEFITRHMSTLGDKAEWRVTMKDGKQVPIALIVPVRAREDNDNPERVTATYLAVAKIAPNEACVTDRISEGTAEAEVRSIADKAQERPCAPPQPVIR